MEAVKILEGSREGLPGVRGSERSESGGGNWRGPPRPGGLRVCHWSGVPYNRFTTGSGWRAGWASEAAVVLLEPTGQHNLR
jgi:hypothetical protein